jgi:hypothetical protein
MLLAISTMNHVVYIMLLTIYTIFTIMLSLPFFWVVLLFHWAPSPRTTMLSEVHYLRHRGDVLVWSPRTQAYDSTLHHGLHLFLWESCGIFGTIWTIWYIYMNHNINNIIYIYIYIYIYTHITIYIYICSPTCRWSILSTW